MISFVFLDHASGTPKYQQIINSVIDAIDNDHLKVGDKIPSVNEVSETTGFAKKTVVQAFDQLKQSGIISSVKYKGYFVASSNTQSKHNIFVLFNSLTAYKEEIYESMKDSLDGKGVVDIFFHHNKIEVFDTLIEQSVGKYTEYIMMPVGNPAIKASLNKLPQDKIYIVDLGYEDWGMKYPSVCQYFEEDIYHCLKDGLVKLYKYNKLIIVVRLSYYNAKTTEEGFKKFCDDHGFEHEVIYHTKNRIPVPGELYITFDDQDLVYLVKKAAGLSLELGRDMGIISYNEIPFKEIVANGIATISTDFTRMGKTIIDLVLHKKKEHLKNPCRLIDRNSF